MSLLHEDERIGIRREGRFLLATLHRPHQVLSTSMVGGGMRDDCTHVVNHQSCEPAGHDEAMRRWRELGAEGSHREACHAIGLDPATTALCGTAANMRCAHLARRDFEEVGVTVVATAGVEGNATRAGDPARWHETPAGSRKVDDAELAGTIVLLAFLSEPCTPGCLTKASILVSEAKTAALWDLRIPSRQSDRPATGTGTDQFAIASPLAREGEWERRHSGTHNKLGQILGEAVHEAVTGALRLQNGLVPSLRGSIWTALGRTGFSKDDVLRDDASLTVRLRELLAANLQSIAHDPQVAAAAYALSEMDELAATGILRRDALREARAALGAALASAVAVRKDRYGDFHDRLLACEHAREVAGLAVRMGFAAKWDGVELV